MAPSDRVAEIVAITAKQTPQPETWSWDICSKIGDNQATRAPPGLSSPPTNLPLVHSQSPKVKSLEGALHGPFCADIATDYCWRKFLRGQTEMPNESDANSCGKQERFTISLEEFWVGSTLGNKAEKRKPCSRRPKNNVVKEPALNSQEIKQQSHEKTRWREQPRARQNTLQALGQQP